ncbi:MAG: transposase zinc-binding domain-containing protein [Magnetococcales bacterium]|nr:transposase zinc-binding domain-containing protein [Magnetococcales bacterium]
MPDNLGYTTVTCPDHPGNVCNFPQSCKSCFCLVCTIVQVDKWVSDMNQLISNLSYFHITFTVPVQIHKLLFECRRFCSNFLYLRFLPASFHLNSYAKITCSG